MYLHVPRFRPGADQPRSPPAYSAHLITCVCCVSHVMWLLADFLPTKPLVTTPTPQVKDRLKMHKQREEDRISGALKKPSAEDEFDSRVRESEVSKRGDRAVK